MGQLAIDIKLKQHDGVQDLRWVIEKSSVVKKDSGGAAYDGRTNGRTDGRTFTCVCVYTQTHVSVCTHRQMCLCVHTDTCVCVYTQTHVSVFTHRHMSLCVHTDTCFCVYTHTRMSVCTHRHMRLCVHTHTCVCVYFPLGGQNSPTPIGKYHDTQVRT